MSVSSARRRVAPLAALVACLLLTACGGDDEAAPADPTPSTVAELDTGAIEVPRLDFCELVPGEAVAAALGGEPSDATERGPGDAEGSGAPLQEVGCSWTSGGTTAAAWVFAEPVGPEQAGRLVAAAGAQPGCEVTEAAYGDPGVRQQCVGQTTDSPRVRYAGLLGDTWLTCELSGPGADGRAEGWCTALVSALDPAA